jgi:hypothetical protein
LTDLSYTDAFMVNRHLRDLLPRALQKIEGKRQERPDLVIAAWKEVIPEKWRPWTEAIAFEKGVVMVKVKNAALYQLLVQQKQGTLLHQLQEKVPEAVLNSIKFLIG